MSLRSITFLQPSRLTFGAGCLVEALTYLTALPSRRIHIVHSSSLTPVVERMKRELSTAGCTITTDRAAAGEPTIAAFDSALARARSADPACIVGIGGGSALDLAKLLASFVRNDQPVEDTFGIGLLFCTNNIVCLKAGAQLALDAAEAAIATVQNESKPRPALAK